MIFPFSLHSFGISCLNYMLENSRKLSSSFQKEDLEKDLLKLFFRKTICSLKAEREVKEDFTMSFLQRNPMKILHIWIFDTQFQKYLFKNTKNMA